MRLMILMKKVLFLMALLMVSSISAAGYGCFVEEVYYDNCLELTYVQGRVYEANTNNSVVGANVNIACYHNNDTNIKTDVTDEFGRYQVIYHASKCEEPDFVSVGATDGSRNGFNDGLVQATQSQNLDIAIIDVPLVPEFGLIIGSLTIISGIALFFIIRKN